MPWTKRNYPASMKNLPAAVRNKSIEIANALLDDTDMKEGIAIATAISRAKDWAANRGKKISKKSSQSRTTDVKKHGEDRYVIPQGSRWAVKKERSKRSEKIFDSKTDAVRTARKEARNANASLTIQKQDGRLEKRISYNPRKRVKKHA